MTNTNDLSEDTCKYIAERTAELILQALFARNRDEISMGEICKEFGISKQTIRRRIRCGVLPAPHIKHGKNYFHRVVIESADFKGLL